MAGVLPGMKCDVPELRGDNYKVWKEKILLLLRWMDIDYAIYNEEPKLTDTSSQDDIALYEHWERSNRISVMFIKTNISSSIRGFVDHHDNVKALLNAIDEHFVLSDKAFASTLIMQFSSMRLTSVKGVLEHVMKMRDIAAQLKNLEIDLPESFFVHYILNTLPLEYEPLKIFYNSLKDKWSINELMTMCVQEEDRLVMDQRQSCVQEEDRFVMEHRESSFFTTSEKVKEKVNFKEKCKIPLKPDIKKESKCFFCKKKGHVKKNCPKYEKWLKNKDNDKPKEASGNGEIHLLPKQDVGSMW